MFVGGVGIGELGLSAFGRNAARGQQRRLRRRHVDRDAVDVPEEGSLHVLGLVVDLGIERDLVDIRRAAREFHARAEGVGESELLGIAEPEARKDEHAAILEGLEAALDHGLVE